MPIVCWRKTMLQYFHSNAYHPRRSDRPCHSKSVRTIRSINFFHNIPSAMTRFHVRQTCSAAHRDFVSKNERMYSATWSRPRAVNHIHTSPSLHKQNQHKLIKWKNYHWTKICLYQSKNARTTTCSSFFLSIFNHMISDDEAVWVRANAVSLVAILSITRNYNKFNVTTNNANSHTAYTQCSIIKGRPSF